MPINFRDKEFYSIENIQELKSLTVHDTKAASYLDIGSNFFLHEDDVIMQKHRAVKCERLIAELNPYVSVQKDVRIIDEDDLLFLTDYQCVVLTDASLSLQCKVDTFCRTQNPPIQFISCNVFGVFAYLFCDFGPEFEVLDTWTEEPKTFFIGNISKSNPGVVTTLDNTYHGLEKGDRLVLKEIVGMTALNESVQTVIEVLSPYSFAICDTSGQDFHCYKYGGTGCLQKPPSLHLTFESLEEQLAKPDIVIADLGKLSLPEDVHVGMHALYLFQEKFGRLPHVRDTKDASELVQIASNLRSRSPMKNINSHIVRSLSHVSRGCFAPLAASMGGIAAQEVLKALTGKFKPLKQWLYLDAIEILSQQKDLELSSFSPRSDRYDALRICVGEGMVNKLKDAKLFMVGCGAIGCELLKNFALLGISCGDKGQITITDNDLIEKSNLNRQFLFRPRHIQKPKSTTAAESAKEINSAIHINAMLHKVAPETEESIFNDEFFESQDFVVNALDNVEARRYVDSRCVRNQTGLLETGTMGAKGHVQVIVPHLTETYTSQRDPEDEEVPFCTLKSFPSVIGHTIQWARDKFESSFAQKVEYFKKFWEVHKTLDNINEKIDSPEELEGLSLVIKMMKNRPKSWSECVAFARSKFEKYFNHKAKHLLLAFPQDTKLKDGSPFWKSPKRPPTPQVFDITDDLHMMFMVSASRLYADIHVIHYSQQDLSVDALSEILQHVDVPLFLPSNKNILTEEGEQAKTLRFGNEDLSACKAELNKLCSICTDISEISKVKPLKFEKDDDTNGHIDFITASANIRARMYNIEPVDRLRVKQIAGNIIPAIATTTAAVAGLASIELIKIMMNCSLDDYRNSFMNLALPYVIFSEPGPANKIVIKEGLSYSVWDHWTIHGNKDYTLRDFINWFKERHGLEVTMVVQGVRMIYIPIMPGHTKRLDQRLSLLVKANSSQKYVDLTVSFASTNAQEDDIAGPPIRYFI